MPRFDESKHPRDKSGKFSEGSQGHGLDVPATDLNKSVHAALNSFNDWASESDLFLEWGDQTGKGTFANRGDFVDELERMVDANELDVRGKGSNTRYKRIETVSPLTEEFNRRMKENYIPSRPGQMSLFSRSGQRSKYSSQLAEALDTIYRQNYAMPAQWDEEKHPRADDGKFSSVEGGGGGAIEDSAAPSLSESAPEPLKNDPEAPAEQDSGFFTAEEMALPEKTQQDPQQFGSWQQLQAKGMELMQKENPQGWLALLNLGQGLSKAIDGTATYINSGDEFNAVLERAGRGGEGPEVIIAPLKGEERATEKAMGKYKGDWSQLQDVVRATVLVPSLDELGEVMPKLRQEMEQRGWSLATRPEDGFGSPTPVGYRDIKMALRAPNGQICEMQVNTHAMFHAKEALGHKLYEEYRSLDEMPEEQRTAEMNQRMDELGEQQRSLYGHAYDRMTGQQDTQQEYPGIVGQSQDERDKDYIKRVADSLPMPSELPEDHNRYFNLEKAKTMFPVSQLRAAGTTNGAARSPKLMRAAYDGHLPKRDPITVGMSRDGVVHVLDGKATLEAAKQFGWKHLPVQFKE